MEFTNGEGVDVIYDPVGGKFAEPAVRSMGWKGRYLVIGFAEGNIPRIPLNLLLLKGCSLVGVFWGKHQAVEAELSTKNIQQLVSWIVDGKLNPLVSTAYPLDQAARALEDMSARKVQGKVVITTSHLPSQDKLRAKL